MFDNTKPNVIILADSTNPILLVKSIGPHKVANRLRKHGYEVAVLQHLSAFTYEELEEILISMVSDKTLFIGVSNMFYGDLTKPIKNKMGVVIDYENATANSILPHGQEFNLKIIDAVKKVSPTCKWVIGGPKAEDLIDNKHFDYIVLGYADNSIINLANHLSAKEPLNKSYKSVFGPIVINDSVAEGYEFTSDIMEFSDLDCILPGETLPIEISRGCIFKCKFCHYPLNGKKKLDFIKHEEILREEFIQNWKKYGITRYAFSDDTFNDSEEKIEMILRISKSLPFKLEYWAYTRLDLMTAKPHTVDMLVESGMIAMFCGIETLNSKSASIIGKGGDKVRQMDTLRYIQTKWPDVVSIHATFILGLPEEDMSSMKKTIDFVLSNDCPVDSVMFFPLGIRDPKSNGFDSDLDLNYKDYGYRFLSYVGSLNKSINWINNFTSFEEVSILAKEVNSGLYQIDNRRQQSIQGLVSTHLLGYGIPREKIHKKPRSKIDMDMVRDLRLTRINEYKKLVYKNFLNKS